MAVSRWSAPGDVRVTVAEATDVAQARRAAARLAEEAGFGDDDKGRLSLVVTEAGTNLLRHAGGGEILVSLPPGGGAAVDVLALDRGPGLADTERSFRDGYSTSGGAGTGLGAVRRLADRVDVHSTPGGGLALLARVSRRTSVTDTAGSPRRDDGTAHPSLVAVGAVSTALHGETSNGDAWVLEQWDEITQLTVVDGLGHGPEAEEAARAAGEAVQAGHGGPAELVRRAHEMLRHTRGAALAVARLDLAADTLTYCGVGNVSGRILGLQSSHSLVSSNGIVGHALPPLVEHVHQWPRAHTLLVMHTDGITGRWTPSVYPKAHGMEPRLLAGLLYRDAGRGKDDATVVVLRDERRA